MGVRAQGTAELKTSDYQTGSYVSVLTWISIEILKKNLCRTTAVDGDLQLPPPPAPPRALPRYSDTCCPFTVPCMEPTPSASVTLRLFVCTTSECSTLPSVCRLQHAAHSPGHLSYPKSAPTRTAYTGTPRVPCGQITRKVWPPRGPLTRAHHARLVER